LEGVKQAIQEHQEAQNPIEEEGKQAKESGREKEFKGLRALIRRKSESDE